MMKNPKTTLASIVGWFGTLGTILGAVGGSCGGGHICGYIGLAGVIVHQIASNLGNAASQDGGL